MLDEAIEGLGPVLGPFGVLNLLKCRPPGNRFDPEAARTCRPFLDRQLALLRPEGLVSLGAKALSALSPEAPRVLRSAGRPLAWGDGWLFPMLHPAATLRARRWRERWDHDTVALGRWLRRAPVKML